MLKSTLTLPRYRHTYVRQIFLQAYLFDARRVAAHGLAGLEHPEHVLHRQPGLGQIKEHRVHFIVSDIREAALHGAAGGGGLNGHWLGFGLATDVLVGDSHQVSNTQPAKNEYTENREETEGLVRVD